MARDTIYDKPLGGGTLEYASMDKEFSQEEWARALAAIRQIFFVGKKVGIVESDCIAIIELAQLPPKLEKALLFKAGLYSGLQVAGHDIEFQINGDTPTA